MRVTDLSTGQDVFLTPDGYSKSCHSLALSRDGGVLVVPGARGAELHDTRTGAVAWSGTTLGTTAVALSPDDSFLAVAGGGAVEVWERATGNLMSTLRLGSVTDVEFSPDGRRVAACGGRAVRCWDVANATNLLEVVPERVAHRLAFSPDGARLAVGESGPAQVFDARTGQQVLRWEVEQKSGATYLVDIAYSPDGRLIAVAGSSSVVVNDARSGEELMRLGEAVRSERSSVWDRPYAQGRNRTTPDGARA